MTAEQEGAAEPASLAPMEGRPRADYQRRSTGGRGPSGTGLLWPLTPPPAFGVSWRVRGNSARTNESVNMLISDMLNEANRELSLRGQVFPKLIAGGRLTEGEANERCD